MALSEVFDVRSLLPQVRQALDSESSEPTKENKANSQRVLLMLKTAVTKHGQTCDEMLELLELCDSELDKSKSKYSSKLLNLLVPESDVDERVVASLMGIFPKLSTKMKASAMKWIWMTKNVMTLDATKLLHAMYDIFFHYLDYASLLPFICRILYPLTKRADVTHFRVVKLVAVFNRSVESGTSVPDLLMLGDLFEYFSPGCMNLPQDRMYKRNPAMYTSTELVKVDTEAITTTVENPVVAKRKLKSNRLALKRKRVRKSTVALLNNKALVLVNCNKLEDLGRLLTRRDQQEVVLPDRCSQVLSNSMCQHLLSVEPSEDRVLRLKSNLAHMLEEEFFALSLAAVDVCDVEASARMETTEIQTRTSDFDTQAGLFASLCDFAQFMQETPLEVEAFLFRYLQTWNGLHHRAYVLKLISRLGPRDYAELYQNVLQPVHRIFVSSDPEVMAAIVLALQKLLSNWAAVDWESHFQGSESSNVFGPLAGGVDHFKVIFELVRYIDSLLLFGLITHRDHPSIQFATTHVYDLVSRLNTEHSIPFILPPSSQLAYRMLFSDNAYAVTSFCEVLTQYKRAYAELQRTISASASTRAKEHPSKLFQAGLSKIKLYNAMVVDFCDVLWLNRLTPMSSTGIEASSLLASSSMLEALALYNIDESALSITSSMAFAGFLARFEAQATGEQKERTEYLQFLKNETGHQGLTEFLNAFIPASRIPTH